MHRGTRLETMISAMALAALAACGGQSGMGPNGGADGGGSGPDAPPGPIADATPTEEPATTTGCDGSSLYELPADTSKRGPWPVGARTVEVGRLRAEVWYPAPFGSDADATRARYDIRAALPASQQSKIADADNPWQDCNCYRDLPLDESHGPYPLVVFVHGTAGFRTQSLTHMTHWASRGFIVIAADHPGLWLADNLAFLCPDDATGSRDLEGDVEALLDAVAQAEGPLAFLSSKVDLARVGLAGHSAGGNAVSGLAATAGVRVIVPMAASGATRGAESVLYLGGDGDSVVSFSSTRSAYDGSDEPRRLVGLGNVGHLGFSDLCATTNTQGQNLVEIAQANDVCGTQLASFLFDCAPTQLAPQRAWDITNYASSAVLEQVLQCATGDRFEGLRERFPDVVEYQQEL